MKGWVEEKEGGRRREGREGGRGGGWVEENEGGKGRWQEKGGKGIGEGRWLGVPKDKARHGNKTVNADGLQV